MASATCELKFNFDFYGPARVAKTALHFFANAITDRLRKRQVCLASRRTTAFERAKIGIKRWQAESMRLPRYFNVSKPCRFEQLSQMSRVT